MEILGLDVERAQPALGIEGQGVLRQRPIGVVEVGKPHLEGLGLGPSLESVGVGKRGHRDPGHGRCAAPSAAEHRKGEVERHGVAVETQSPVIVAAVHDRLGREGSRDGEAVGRRELRPVVAEGHVETAELDVDALRDGDTASRSDQATTHVIVEEADREARASSLFDDQRRRGLAVLPEAQFQV